MGVAFESDGWHGLARSPDDASFFSPLDRWLSSHPGVTVVHYPSREVRCIEIPGGRVFCKIIRALTDSGLRGEEWFSWCKWVFRPSRSIAAFRISEALLDAGLECAEPLLAVRRRNGLIPTELFITRGVPYPDLWQEPGMPSGELADFLAVAAAGMHDAGFAHGDYILRNLCRNPDTNQAILLDNDRTWRPPPLLRRHFFRRNLAQMCYSLLRRFDPDEAPAHRFLAGYAGQRHSLSSARQDAILASCRRRLQERRRKIAARS